MNFTAIDFETANAGRASACALGLVQVNEGQIIAEHNWLIDPQSPFDGRNIAIHGITPSMVRGQPTFVELWPTLEPLLQGQIVVAHNASFDMSVIRYCLDEAGTSYPSFQYLCTYEYRREAGGRRSANDFSDFSDFSEFSDSSFRLGINQGPAYKDKP
ncbi:3'-5' exonuclease [Paenibacillus stellifer]|uniref:3'-5' exonuclease n=1 Tax=Paenibacillus stellifer TaxID=169760 RepID=UPI0009FBD1BB|nr:3'-5' exonuclease [Paenibacillus stellifer]